ncbi:DUF1049 domain-containing protein [Arthrobacter deserti]|uniref:DUF1049 domain-containing protein n=1 Tax=Arthrobacter deserti TaxID=1742687 RepID=A0ABX1JPL0_9MICC|nr:DUF1049 domain-containing protein [Arthrobacter deserti]
MTQDPLAPDTPPRGTPGTAGSASGTGGPPRGGALAAGPSGTGPAGTASGGAAPDAGSDASRRVTRTGVLWTATVGALVLLILLIIFIAQNQHTVPLHYFAFDGTVSLGLALFIAAVVGAVLVAIVGAARIIQLRLQNRLKQHHRRR